MTLPKGAARYLLAALGLVAAAALVLAFDSESGLGPRLETHRGVARARARVAELETERDTLLERIRGLRSDPFAIEAAARESLGMARPGEVVVRLSPPPPLAGPD